jgi:hypothetical protein
MKPVAHGTQMVRAPFGAELSVHGVHEPPVPGCTCPDAHATHDVPCALPSDPAGQTAHVEPAELTSPAAHRKHTVLLVAASKPALHTAHAVPPVLT